MIEHEPHDVEVHERPRVAIIGYGLAGAVFHGPLIAATPGMEVSAIVTANPARRARAKRDFPGAVVYETAEKIWRSADLFDLVVVATPNRFHASLATTSMQNGIPVVVDKPLAISEEEARALIATSEQTCVPLTCFQNRRWDGDFLTVQRLLDENLLGTITRFESRFERYRPAVRSDAWREHTPVEEGGGLLWDLGSHLIDQALVLFGEPVRVYAEMTCRRPGAEVDDDTVVALTFADAVNAQLWMSVVTRILGPRFRVQGLLGAYEKYGLDPQEDALRAGARPGSDSWGQEPRSAWGRLLTDVRGVTFDGAVETLAGAYPRFYAGVRDALTNKKALPVDPRDALRTLHIIEAARRSAQTGTVVHL